MPCAEKSAWHMLNTQWTLASFILDFHYACSLWLWIRDPSFSSHRNLSFLTTPPHTAMSPSAYVSLYQIEFPDTRQTSLCLFVIPSCLGQKRLPSEILGWNVLWLRVKSDFDPFFFLDKKFHKRSRIKLSHLHHFLRQHFLQTFWDILLFVFYGTCLD